MKYTSKYLLFLFTILLFAGNVFAEEFEESISLSSTLDGKVHAAKLIVQGKLRILPTTEKTNVLKDKIRRLGEIEVEQVIKGKTTHKILPFEFWWSDSIKVKLNPAYKEGDTGLWFLFYDYQSNRYMADNVQNFISRDPKSKYEDQLREIAKILQGFANPQEMLKAEDARVRAAALYAIGVRTAVSFSKNVLKKVGADVLTEEELKTLKQELEKENLNKKVILKKMAKDKDPRTAIYAMCFLVRDFDDQTVVPKLIEMLKQKSNTVRFLAADALHAITGRTFLFGKYKELGTLWQSRPEIREKLVAIWEKWYSKNKDKHFLQWIVESINNYNEPFWTRNRGVKRLQRITGLTYRYEPYADTNRERRQQLDRWKMWWTDHGQKFLERRYPEWIKKHQKNGDGQEADENAENFED